MIRAMGVTTLAAILAVQLPAIGGDVAPLIQAIKDAPDVSAAGQAYMAAHTADGNNPDVHRAYVRRMVQLGHPRSAILAAKALNRMKPEDPLALGVIGYVQLRQDKLAEAYDTISRATLADGKNPGLLKNMGMLVVWQGRTDTPVDEKAAKRVEENLATWSQEKACQEGAAEANKVIDEQDKHLKVHRARLAKAQEQFDKAEKAEGAAKRALMGREGMAKTAGRQMRERQADLRKQAKTGIRDSRAQGGVEDARVFAAGQHAEAKQVIPALRKALAKAKKSTASAKRNLDSARRSHDARKRSLPGIPWSPPAVDGVVTPEAGLKALPMPRTAVKAPVAGKKAPVDKPVDKNTEAEGQLKLAKLMLANGRREKALGMFKLITERYPGTPAAKEAEAALAKAFRAP